MKMNWKVLARQWEANVLIFEVPQEKATSQRTEGNNQV